MLVEYFFEAPAILERKNPELYRMLAKMFRQDTATFLPGVSAAPRTAHRPQQPLPLRERQEIQEVLPASRRAGRAELSDPLHREHTRVNFLQTAPAPMCFCL